LPLALSGAVRRTFDTPGFAGMTFYEVQAKSIINRVPAASRMPFQWTLNPYRGCGHACVYCLDGDTPVLMADGRTRPIRELEVGDRIYGTTGTGRDQRYEPTTVLAHWSTVKRAYRVELADGTTLIASGDHRFLTERGWKHVAAAPAADRQRPYLTTKNQLIGVGSLGVGAKDTPDYRRGYLAGIIRGAGHLRSYDYPYGVIHQFRLALTDPEALERARGYLAELGIATKEFVAPVTRHRRKECRTIRTQSEGAIGVIGRAIAWPEGPGRDWQTGFLAGLFDGVGEMIEKVGNVIADRLD